MDIDEVLKHIGECGKYQWFLAGIFSYGVFIDAFIMMVVTFITTEPDWICVKGYNSSICNFTEPITLTSTHYKARCDMPREAWSYVEGFTSLVTEYDLVCDKSLLQSLAQSSFFAGMCLGLIIGGYLSDRFGRRIIYYGGFALVIVVTWIIVFPESFILFIAGRIIIGFGYGLVNGCGFVLLMEYTTVKYRAKVGWIANAGWVIGNIILASIAYFIRAWRLLFLVTAAISTPILLIWWILPESTRWLLLHGKEEKAKAQLKKVAKINGKQFPKTELKKPKDAGQHRSFKQLFYNWEVTKRTLICWNIWFTVSLVYYAATFGSVELGGNRYLSYALIFVIEIPESFLTVFSANRFGRKKSVIIGLVISAIASIISVSIPFSRSNTSYNVGRQFSNMVAKFSSHLSFVTAYIWTSELFPTIVRSKGFSTSSAFARIGSFTSSYVIWLVRIHPLLPYGIIGVFCLQAIILATLLPETMNTPTMEVMDDLIKSKHKKEYIDIEQPKKNQAAETLL